MDIKNFSFLLPVILLFGALYFIRPWLHSLILNFYINPFIVQSVLIGLIAGGLFYWKGTEQKTEGDQIYLNIDSSVINAFTAVFLVLVMVGGVANTAFTNVSMAEDTQQEVTEIDSLPDIDNENPRILPRTVAAEFA
ncbi:MAG: hypothetical protein V5A72_03515 [Candidatus Nanohaloarchaea archaeon]